MDRLHRCCGQCACAGGRGERTVRHLPRAVRVGLALALALALAAAAPVAAVVEAAAVQAARKRSVNRASRTTLISTTPTPNR